MVLLYGISIENREQRVDLIDGFIKSRMYLV